MSDNKRNIHFLVFILDTISIIISGLSAYLLAFSFLIRGTNIYNQIDSAIYRRYLIIAIIAYTIVKILSLIDDSNYLKRSYTEELLTSLKIVLYMMGLIFLYFYFAKLSYDYSRIFIGIFTILFILIDSILRNVGKKKFTSNHEQGESVEKILMITTSDNLDKIYEEAEETKDWRNRIMGIILLDHDRKGETYKGVPIISNLEDMWEDILTLDYDSILLAPKQEYRHEINEWLSRFQKLGKNVHVSLEETDYKRAYRTFDQVGDLPVVTYHAESPMPRTLVIIKRILDIVLSILSLPIFLISFVLAVISKLFVEGPLLSRHLRVGKNGRHFVQLHYRTLKLDCKNDKDYTLLGKLFQALHLDGIPQIINVLSGEMSFVGPKAVSLSQYLELSDKERSNLSIAPGITGYRNYINDEAKIVENNSYYISRWNIFKDLHILLRSLLGYFTKHQSRDRALLGQEEMVQMNDYKTELAPIEYDHSLYTSKTNVVYLFIKRLVDIIASFLGIIVLSPIFIIISILIIRNDGGTPFYSHTRLGKDGKKIKVYKFRSMRLNADRVEDILTPEQLEQYQKEFKVDNDPRITKLGSFLRETSLDELPQLFNIFNGTMSIIGPRPIVEEEASIYGDQIGKLLSVKPGLTGYWQAYARNNATYETGERQKMEMYYIDNQSLWLDIKIFFKTFSAVFSRRGAQ